ncbi:hypothetical protein RJ641_011090 [Dillenia turbinata]|uniref:Uncharacterized protein n=1 Tax=Dillenia turbinata TaxID=194707 RepID=A0AAN8Z304_9MAGN
MGRMEYLRMKTDPASDDLINADLMEIKIVAKRLFDHLLVGIGSHQLENKHADFPFSPLHFLQSSSWTFPYVKVITSNKYT